MNENNNYALKNELGLEKKIYNNTSDKTKLNFIKEEYKDLYDCFKSFNINITSRRNNKKTILTDTLNNLLLSFETALESKNNKKYNENSENIEALFNLSLNYAEKIFDILLKDKPFNYELFENFYKEYLKPELDSNYGTDKKRKNICKKLTYIFKALFSYYESFIDFERNNSKIREMPSYFEKLYNIIKGNGIENDAKNFIKFERKIPSLIKNGMTKDEKNILMQILREESKSKIYFGLNNIMLNKNYIFRP
ncbi:MAG: hypothetical protein QXU20_00120 [Candidatus Woesearchaeota archaeon]